MERRLELLSGPGTLAHSYLYKCYHHPPSPPPAATQWVVRGEVE